MSHWNARSHMTVAQHKHRDEFHTEVHTQSHTET